MINVKKQIDEELRQKVLTCLVRGVHRQIIEDIENYLLDFTDGLHRRGSLDISPSDFHD